MKLYIVFIENIDTIYSNIFTEKHRFHRRIGILKVAEMNISVRLYTILHKHGIENIEDMSNYTSDDIIHWKDIGRRSLEELLSTMKSNSIKFKGE